MNYYNDNEPFVGKWLEDLIAAGELSYGPVDSRNITEVLPDGLEAFTQCHFFAGIGGWPLALKWAGWPDDAPVWTGSCPCQPFSQAGKRKGQADERHLWPEFLRLITECRPPVIFGEQVGGPLGRQWLTGVYADLEEIDYRVPRDEQGNYEFYDIPAAGTGAPHIRQRLFWVADTAGTRPEAWQDSRASDSHASHGARGEQPQRSSSIDRLADTECNGGRKHEQGREEEGGASDRGIGAGTGGHYVHCRDGKTRRVPDLESGFFKMAHGIPADLEYNESGLCGVDDSPGKITEGESVDASQEERPEEDMPALQDVASPEAIQRPTRRPDSVSEEGVLQSDVHGGGHGGGNQKPQREELTPAISQRGGKQMQTMRTERHVIVQAPQRRKSAQQRRIQFDYCVRLLSSSLALAKLRGDHEATKALQDLREAIYETGSVRHPSATIGEAWGSLKDEEMERIRVGFANRACVISSLAPLAYGIPRKLGPPLTGMGQVGIRAARANRVGRLRGYGNAVVPELAAEFVRAYLESMDQEEVDCG